MDNLDTACLNGHGVIHCVGFLLRCFQGWGASLLRQLGSWRGWEVSGRVGITCKALLSTFR